MSELEDAIVQARLDAWDKIVAWADTRPSGIMSVPRKEKAYAALARLERLVRLDARLKQENERFHDAYEGYNDETHLRLCKHCQRLRDIKHEIAEAVK